MEKENVKSDSDDESSNKDLDKLTVDLSDEDLERVAGGRMSPNEAAAAGALKTKC